MTEQNENNSIESKVKKKLETPMTRKEFMRKAKQVGKTTAVAAAYGTTATVAGGAAIQLAEYSNNIAKRVNQLTQKSVNHAGNQFNSALDTAETHNYPSVSKISSGIIEIDIEGVNLRESPYIIDGNNPNTVNKKGIKEINGIPVEGRIKKVTIHNGEVVYGGDSDNNPDFDVNSNLWLSIPFNGDQRMFVNLGREANGEVVKYNPLNEFVDVEKNEDGKLMSRNGRIFDATNTVDIEFAESAQNP